MTDQRRDRSSGTAARVRQVNLTRPLAYSRNTNWAQNLDHIGAPGSQPATAHPVVGCARSARIGARPPTAIGEDEPVPPPCRHGLGGRDTPPARRSCPSHGSCSALPPGRSQRPPSDPPARLCQPGWPTAINRANTARTGAETDTRASGWIGRPCRGPWIVTPAILQPVRSKVNAATRLRTT